MRIQKRVNKHNEETGATGLWGEIKSWFSAGLKRVPSMELHQFYTSWDSGAKYLALSDNELQSGYDEHLQLSAQAFSPGMAASRAARSVILSPHPRSSFLRELFPRSYVQVRKGTSWFSELAKLTSPLPQEYQYANRVRAFQANTVSLKSGEIFSFRITWNQAKPGAYTAGNNPVLTKDSVDDCKQVE